MSNIRVISAAATVVGLTLLGSPATAAEQPRPDTHRYIVVVNNDGVDGDTARKVAKHYEKKFGSRVSHTYGRALEGYAADMTADQAKKVSKDSRVGWVQRDRLVRTMEQQTPTGVDRVQADLSDTSAIDGKDERVNVDVAIIDTGVDLDHPDLRVNQSGAKNCSNGRRANDGNGHGTHVAGTIGALDNSRGVVGVAPGARIWPVRVLDNQGTGSIADVVCGIDYVTAHANKIEVANMSLGGTGSDDGNCGKTDGDAMHEAICSSVAAGVTYAVAAGNSESDAAAQVPAAYDEVITVSALADFDGKPGGLADSTCFSDQDDTFADFSNYGNDVDLIAPGVCVRSTWKNGKYNTISGTSMATPHVTGAAALYSANHGSALPSTVQSALAQNGSTNWTWPSQDQDGIQEPLLDVSAY